MYKIGQKARIIKDDYPFETGEIATITEVEDDDYQGDLPFTAKVGDKEDWVTEGCFELLETKGQPFKVGDRVKVIRDSDYGETKPGYVGTVTKIEDSFDGRDVYIDDFPVRSSDLEKVEEDRHTGFSFGPINTMEIHRVGQPRIHLCEPGDHSFTGILPRNLELDDLISTTRNMSFSIGYKPKRKGGGYMSQLSKLAKKLLDPDTKALVKAGVLDNELEVTDEGADFILTFLVDQNKAELAKEARKQLREQKREEDEE